MKKLNFNSLLRWAFLLSVFALAGSLYFSEVMKLPPCSLCWYQRICMYPLVVIYFLDLIRGYKTSFHYAFPLILIGLFFSTYHNLLYYGVIPDSITPCTQGISCTSKQIEWLGFITIPLLSFTAFVAQFAIVVSGLTSLRKEGFFEK